MMSIDRQGLRRWQNTRRDARTSYSASMFAVTAARTIARISAPLIVLTALFTFSPAGADSDYKKICKIGVNLKALAEDGNANSCRALAITSNVQDYQIGCQDARNENLVMLTTPINVNDKSARLTSASLAANALNAKQNVAEFAACAKFWGNR
jgi:hypothetical protein